VYTVVFDTAVVSVGRHIQECIGHQLNCLRLFNVHDVHCSSCRLSDNCYVNLFAVKL